MSVENSGDGFAARLAGYLQKTDYRLADSQEKMHDIFKLRYKSYSFENAILPNAVPIFRDHYDDMDNCWNFSVHVDGIMTSAVRFHVLSAETPYGPACDFFPDIVKPMLDEGMILIDPTRFVSDPSVRHLYREIPYVTVRVPAMAYEHFQANYSLASVRKEHQAFYRRVFNAEALCEPRPYPPLTVRLGLMKLRLDQARENLLARYPIFASSFTERRLLFDRNESSVVIERPAKEDVDRFSPRMVS